MQMHQRGGGGGLSERYSKSLAIVWILYWTKYITKHLNNFFNTFGKFFEQVFPWMMYAIIVQQLTDYQVRWTVWLNDQANHHVLKLKTNIGWTTPAPPLWCSSSLTHFEDTREYIKTNANVICVAFFMWFVIILNWFDELPFHRFK